MPDSPGREFVFDPGDPSFPDHFPGFPVVPGSVLLDRFNRTVTSSLRKDGGTLRLREIRDARFSRFCRPGRVLVRYQTIGPACELCFRCQAEQEGVIICSAILCYGGEGT